MNMFQDKEFFKLSQMDLPIEKLLNVGYRSYIPGWSFKRVGKTCTLYYVISGAVSFVAEGVEYICEKNDIFHLSKEEVSIIQNTSATEKCELFFLTFDLKEGICLKDLKIERPLHDETKEFYTLFRKVYKTHLAEGFGYKIKGFYEFTQLIYEMMTHRLNRDENCGLYLKLDKAIQYIKMNYYKNITVEELARISGYSVSHFRKLFVETCGVSPQEYMLDYKIRKASEMLRDEPEKSVEEIAELLGICNTSHFCKMFKKRVGCSPHKFKKDEGAVYNEKQYD